MKKLSTVGKVLYAISMIGIGLYQLIYGEFSVMMMPPWPIQNGLYTAVAHAWNTSLIIAGLAMLTEKRIQMTSLLLGGCLLILCLISYVPYELMIEPYSRHLPLWTNALKEFAFAGGAFVIAGTTMRSTSSNSALMRALEKLIPYGHAFFCITMISFGLMHLLYIEHVCKLVPTWIPFPVFWTGITGLALIGSGLCIVAKVKLRLVSNLLALMIFMWFIILHLPRAIEPPLAEHGNEITSALSALIFAGTALVIGNSTQSHHFENS